MKKTYRITIELEIEATNVDDDDMLHELAVEYIQELIEDESLDMKITPLS